MTFIEGLAGFIASVFAIIFSIGMGARFLGKKFDGYIETVVANTAAIKSLTRRVTKLESTIGATNGD